MAEWLCAGFVNQSMWVRLPPAALGSVVLMGTYRALNANDVGSNPTRATFGSEVLVAASPAFNGKGLGSSPSGATCIDQDSVV